jgi:hypothetical protein
MAHHLTGWGAIEWAERHGGTLQKYADPTERALKRISIEKAKRIAREDPRLIHLSIKHGSGKNPSRRLTKAQKRQNASKRAKEKRVALALKKFLHAQNPAVKTAGASIVRLKGGTIKITPIKANPRGLKKYWIVNGANDQLGTVEARSAKEALKKWKSVGGGWHRAPLARGVHAVPYMKDQY